MQLKFCLPVLAVTAALSGTGAAHAASVWNEGTNGDLSGDWLAPTQLVLTVGSNTVIGSTGNTGAGVDRDYFTFTIPVGAALTSLMLLPDTAVSGGVSFIGFQSGSQFTSPSTVQPGDLLGFSHYSNDQIGTDMLPTTIFGFTGALPSGTYVVWVQDTGGPATYGFDFGVTEVPVPAAAWLFGSGLLGLASLRRRKA